MLENKEIVGVSCTVSFCCIGKWRSMSGLGESRSSSWNHE